MADIKVYKNEDYTASRVKHDNGKVDYFIKFHSSTNPQEVKVNKKEFLLYVGEFRKNHERQRNGKRRHIHNGDLKDIDESKPSLTHITDFSKQYDTKVSVDMILKTCTPVQQRRFMLHHKYGFSRVEIAKIERCNEAAIRKSLKAVDEKIKFIFSEGTISPDF
jgi:hypothetical protein